MKKVKAVCLIMAVLMLISGCSRHNSVKTPVSGTGKDESNPSIHIGNVSGVEFDTAKNEIIYPYGRITLSHAKDAAEGFGIVDENKEVISNATAELSFSQTKENTVDIGHKWENGSLTTRLSSNTDGTMTLVQSANADGISGLRFGFEIPNTYNIILPTSNGVELSAEHPKLWSDTSRIQYPDEWNMQMLLIQGDNGGLLIYAVDDGTQFKALNLGSDESNFRISVETIPQAPFTQYQSFETVEWRLVPYKGNWTQGAALYRSFADEKFGLSEANESKPDWARDMQVFVLSDLDDLSMLDELAKEVDPKKTLLQYPAWRLNPYDVNYPDYTATADAKKIIDYAHSLGFRVQLHINMNACQDDMSEYKRFKDYATLDAYTGEVYYYTTSDSNRSYKFTQINPASAEWRSFMIDTLKRVVVETGADALHLDQSLLCYNDGRGLVDGLTSMQGNVLYHKELAEALPDVAIGSEGVTDINVRYTSFAQSCAYAIDWMDRTYNEDMIKQITPVNTAVYDSYISFYHWPGEPTTFDEDFWQSWYRTCNMRCGFKPTIMRCSAEEIAKPNDTMKMFLREAKWYCENAPVNIYTDWTDDTLMRYRLSNGKIAEYKKDSTGEVLLTDASDPSSELTRFVTGVATAKLSGTISGWRYYDSEKILGLNPDKSYLYSAESRSETQTHITEMSDNLTVLDLNENESFAAVSLRKVNDDSKIITDFMNYDGAMRACEVLYDSPDDISQAKEYRSKYSVNLAFRNLGVFKHLGDRFLMHPPWLTEDGSIGYTYTEFDIKLGTYGNAVFSASVQMASAANAAISDGVTYRFYVWKTSDTRPDEPVKTVEVKDAIPVPVTLDLTEYEGSTVTIRVEVHPGKTTANDSSVLVEPRVIQVKAKEDTKVSYTIVTEKPVLSLLSSDGKATMKSAGVNTYRVEALLGETVYFVYDKTPVSAALHLCDTDFTGTNVYNDGTLGISGDELLPRMQVAEVDEVLTQGIFAHPPTDGKCQVSFVITVPENGLTLCGAIGLKNGSSESDGVTFSVDIDGTRLWEEKAAAGAGLREFSVSLKKYVGKTVLLSLITAPGESSAYDYAFWSDPRLIN